MVDTWRSPKALYSALRMSASCTPSVLALVAVDIQLACRPRILRVAGDVAEHRIGAHALLQFIGPLASSSGLTLCSVYW
jgi:hypothetical protein